MNVLQAESVNLILGELTGTCNRWTQGWAVRGESASQGLRSRRWPSRHSSAAHLRPGPQPWSSCSTVAQRWSVGDGDLQVCPLDQDPEEHECAGQHGPHSEVLIQKGDSIQCIRWFSWNLCSKNGLVGCRGEPVDELLEKELALQCSLVRRGELGEVVRCLQGEAVWGGGLLASSLQGGAFGCLDVWEMSKSGDGG